MHAVLKFSGRGPARATTAWLLVALLIAPLGVGPVRAETPVVIARGTVDLPNQNSALNPDAFIYRSNLCKGDRLDGRFAAFVDLRAYQHKTLRFVGEGASMPARVISWQLQRATGCPSGAGSYQGPVDIFREPDSLTWENNTYVFLYILRRNDAELPPALYGHYRVELLEP